MIKQRLDFLDFAKGFAMISIVTFHYLQPYVSGIFAQAIMVGGTGVHLFFIMSGFGLAMSSMRLSLLDFYKKRISKILIPYYLIVSLIYLISLAHPLYPDASLYALFGHLFLYKMFDESIMVSFGYHFWFMSTIIQFYLFFPLIMKIKRTLSDMQFVIGSMMISIFYWILISILELSEMRVFNSFFLQFFWEFCLGIVWAQHYKKTGKIFIVRNRLALLSMAVVGFGLMAIMVIKGGRLGQTFNDVPASIGFAAFTCFLYLLVNRWSAVVKLFVLLGRNSYEWYLTHMLLFILLNEWVIRKILGFDSLWTSMLVALPLSVVIAMIYSRVVSHLVLWLGRTKASA